MAKTKAPIGGWVGPSDSKDGLSSQKISGLDEIMPRFQDLTVDGTFTLGANAKFANASSVSIDSLFSGIISDVRVVSSETFSTIQSAVDDVPNAGGLVFIPAGTYTVSAAILGKSNLHLIGAGRDATIIKLANSSDVDVIQFPNGTVDASVSSLTIDGNRANQTDTAITGISILSTTGSPSARIALENLYILNVRNDGILIDGATTDVRISNNFIDGTDLGAGIELASGTDTTTRVIVSNNNIRNVRTAGIAGTGPITHVTISGNTIDTTVTADCITAYNQANAFITVTGNTCENSGNHGIHVTGDDISISGNVIESPTNNGIFLSHSSETPASQATRISVSNNSATGGTIGISVFNVRSASLVGNTIDGPSNSGIQHAIDTTTTASDYFTIAGNIIRGATNDGIGLRSGVNHGAVIGNILEGNGRDGIRIADSGTGNANIIVALNRATGNTGLGILEQNNASANLFFGNHLAGNTGGAKTLLTNGVNTEVEDLLIDQGVAADGGGFKHSRVTTGSINASSSAAVTVTWTTAFADANYTVHASVVEADTDTATLQVDHIESVSASAVVVRVENEDAGGAKTGTLNVIAVHD